MLQLSRVNGTSSPQSPLSAPGRVAAVGPYIQVPSTGSCPAPGDPAKPQSLTVASSAAHGRSKSSEWPWPSSGESREAGRRTGGQRPQRGPPRTAALVKCPPRHIAISGSFQGAARHHGNDSPETRVGPFLDSPSLLWFLKTASLRPGSLPPQVFFPLRALGGQQGRLPAAGLLVLTQLPPQGQSPVAQGSPASGPWAGTSCQIGGGMRLESSAQSA